MVTTHVTLRSNYEERLNRVIAYIYDHLDEEIDLQKLADVACMSPYHWHRVYHAVRGETIAVTVKRLRLHRAAGYLAHSDMPVDEVAQRSGYPNRQSFTRIFKSVYGMPPAQYRKNGGHSRFTNGSPERAPIMYSVEIKNVPAMKAATTSHSGSYMEVGKAFDRLFGWLAAQDLMKDTTRIIGVYYDDPDSIPEAELRSQAGAVLSSSPDLTAPFEYTEIQGGSYAVLKYKGPYADMKAAYQWFYGEWLTESGREAANAPCFEEYLNNPQDTAPNDLMTNIHMPLK
ncbi:GyrI-like domain-containing protein [Pelagibius sp. Alg239-R121]|uniref:AraC family transcriptional regulator n=1 Tax=Pelagibius sp. Alg239-R121 TaxID=2993448 RepID=UPI0024A63D61|nr:AraC family transcriptional regulator [Pelagibius sp. Alg239-R121]